MFKIYDGRSHFYQWDIDRKLIVEDASISEVHFCNQTDNYSLVCKTYIEDGLNLVNVPNILLQNDWRINVYAYDSNYTKFSEQFDVIRRCKPEDYVYTETEILNYNTLSDRITKIEEGGGITPTIGDNGNWYLGSTDTGKPSRGEKGPKGDKGATGATGNTGATGADGKSAYSYAQDGGYTGTEEEFAAKLAAEGLDKALFVVNITSNGDGTYSANKTFAEIVQVYNEGKYNIVAIMALRTGSHIMPLLAAQKTGAVFGMVLGQTRFSFVITSNNEVQREMIQLATLKNKLPNPYPLTFTGAVNETYDGSSAKTIEIPSGGTGGGGALSGLAIADNYDIELISHVIIDQENIPTAGITVTQKDDGSPFAYDGLLIWTDAKSASSYTTFNFNGYTNYPIEMTHGNKNLLSMYITDGTTMSIIIDRVRNIIKQSYADTGSIFYPDAIFQRVPEKFTSFKIGADGIASVKFYKAWGLTRK